MIWFMITARWLKITVGDVIVDTSLEDDGDIITPASGIVWKILSYGTSIEDTNLSLQISRDSDGDDMRLSQKGSSDKGQFGTLLANVASNSDSFTSAMIPIFLDDTTNLRLSGDSGSSSLVYVAYVIIEE